MLWTKPFYLVEAPCANLASPAMKKALGKMQAVTDEGEHIVIIQWKKGMNPKEQSRVAGPVCIHCQYSVYHTLYARYVQRGKWYTQISLRRVLNSPIGSSLEDILSTSILWKQKKINSNPLSYLLWVAASSQTMHIFWISKSTLVVWNWKHSYRGSCGENCIKVYIGTL